MPRNDEVLNVGVNLEIQTALRSLSQFERNMQKALKGVSRALGQMGEVNKKVTKKATKETSEWHKELSRLTKGVDGLEKSLGKGGGKKGGKTGGFDKKALRKEAKEAWKTVIDDFKGSWNSFFSKDLKGSIESLGKNFGSMLAAGAKGIHAKGAGKGGVMGGMSKGMGGLIKVFTKIGPILSMAASAIMAIVKVMIDAEAQAKEFNKQILASASSAEFLAVNAGNADAAFDDMKQTLKGIRDAAYSLDNLSWGISAEEHKAVITKLTEEGVTLTRIAQEAKNSGKTVEEFSAKMTHVGVAYSRAFGVPLNSINELQGQMMTEMGMSLEETRRAFGQMTRAASESGIASNKFFAEIRGVSQDLSLYNNRMEDAVKMLGMLGKVMNPRNAAKFMQSSMQALKGMGRQQKIQAALLSNPGKIIAKDQERRVKDLAKTLKMEAGAVKGILETQGTKGLEEAIGKLEKGRQGAIREQALETEMNLKAGKKGLVGQAMVMGEVGPGAAAQILAKAATSLAGGQKSLTDAIGNLGVEMTADMLGISNEQLRGAAKLEYAVNQQREELKKELAAGGSTRLAALQKLEKANIKEGDITSAGWDEIINTFSEGQKEALDEEGLSPLEKMTKKQGDLTQSILDKFQVIIDFLMNQIYSVMTGIWEGVMSFAGLFGETDQMKMKKLEQSIIGMSEGENKKILMDLLKETAGMTSGERLQKVGGMASGLMQAENDQIMKNANMKAFGLDKVFEDMAKSGQPITKDQAVLAQLKAIMMSDIGATGKEFGVSEENIKVMQSIADELRNAAESGNWDDKKAVEHYGPLLNDLMAPWAAAKQSAEAAGVTPGGNLQFGPSSGLDLQGAKVPKYSELDAQGKKDLWWQDFQSKGGNKNIDKAKNFADAQQKKRETTDKILLDNWSESLVLTGQTNKQIEGLENLLAHEGTAFMKFPRSWLAGPYKKTIEEAVLKSVRTALVEYFLLQDLSPDDVAEYITNTNDSFDAFMSNINKGVRAGKSVEDITGLKREEADEEQTGGVVTGVRGGLALVKSAAGEGLTSIGKGEVIVPKGGTITRPGEGGGGGTIRIMLDPNAAKLIRAEAHNAIYEHEARRGR